MSTPRLPAHSFLSRIRLGLAALLVSALTPAVHGQGIPPGLQLPQTLRIQNDAQYDIVSLKVAGLQLLGPGKTVPPQGATSAAIPAGPKTVEAKLGVVGPAGGMLVLVTINKKVTVPATGQVTVRIDRLHVRQLLSGFSSSRSWEGRYFQADELPRIRTYTFLSNGRWVLRQEGTVIASGTVTQVEWSDRAQTVRFKLDSHHLAEVIELGVLSSFFVQRVPSPGDVSMPDDITFRRL